MIDPAQDRITLPEERLVPSVARPRARPPSGREALLAGLRWTAERAAGREARVVAVFTLVFAVAAGAIERRAASLGALDRAVVPVFRLVVPLAVVAWARAFTAGRRLGDAAWALSRFGLDTRLVAAGAVAGAAGVAALLGAVAAAAVAASAGAGLGDLALTARLGAQIAPTYLGLAAVAATLPVRRAGLWLVILDALLWGASWTPLLAFPGPHVRSLVGVAPAGGLTQGQSALALAALAVLLGLAACARTGPGQREG